MYKGDLTRKEYFTMKVDSFSVRVANPFTVGMTIISMAFMPFMSLPAPTKAGPVENPIQEAIALEEWIAFTQFVHYSIFNQFSDSPCFLLNGNILTSKEGNWIECEVFAEDEYPNVVTIYAGNVEFIAGLIEIEEGFSIYPVALSRSTSRLETETPGCFTEDGEAIETDDRYNSCIDSAYSTYTACVIAVDNELKDCINLVLDVAGVGALACIAIMIAFPPWSVIIGGSCLSAVAIALAACYAANAYGRSLCRDNLRNDIAVCCNALKIRTGRLID